MFPKVLHGHSRPLTVLKFNRDGDLLFTACKGGIVCVWYTDSGERLGTYEGHNGVVWDLDVTADSKYLITCSGDACVFIWSVLSGRKSHDYNSECVCKAVEWNQMPDNQHKFALIMYGFADSGSAKIRFVEWHKGRKEKQLGDDIVIKDARAQNIRWGPFDETVVVGMDDGSIAIYDVEDGTQLHKQKLFDGMVTCIDGTPDRYLFLLSSSDMTCKLWDYVTKEVVKTFTSDRPLDACCLSPLFQEEEKSKRRYHILCGGGQKAEQVTQTAMAEGKFQALLYHIITGEMIGSVKGHFGPIHTLSFRSDGKGYASGAEDGVVRLHEFDDDYFSAKFE